MTISSSTIQLTNIIMTNHYYQYQNLYYSWILLTVFIFLIQSPILTIAQQNQYQSTDTSNPRSITTTTIISAILNNNDDSFYDGESENSAGDMYADDDGENLNHNLPSSSVSESQLNNNNRTKNLNTGRKMHEYDDEASSYQDEDDLLDDHVHGDRMSGNHFESKRPINDSNNKKSLDSQTTSRMPFISSNFLGHLFSRPVILVGCIGGVVISILSAILLVMFIIYRMRKKDEGSYALEEGPRKSPSHAYTRVSSREFFA